MPRTESKEESMSFSTYIGLVLRSVAVATAAATLAHAQPAFPDRPVTTVVPFAPGGGVVRVSLAPFASEVVVG